MTEATDDDTRPTPDDLARDLREMLRQVRGYQGDGTLDWAEVPIKRALAAEAEVGRLRAENARLCKVVQHLGNAYDLAVKEIKSLEDGL